MCLLVSMAVEMLGCFVGRLLYSLFKYSIILEEICLSVFWMRIVPP